MGLFMCKGGVSDITTLSDHFAHVIQLNCLSSMSAKYESHALIYALSNMHSFLEASAVV